MSSGQKPVVLNVYTYIKKLEEFYPNRINE